MALRFCHFYGKIGGCRNGNECKFIHEKSYAPCLDCKSVAPRVKTSLRCTPCYKKARFMRGMCEDCGKAKVKRPHAFCKKCHISYLEKNLSFRKETKAEVKSEVKEQKKAEVKSDEKAEGEAQEKFKNMINDTYIVKLKYRVREEDHSGYCSDAGDITHTVQTVNSLITIKALDELLDGRYNVMDEVVRMIANGDSEISLPLEKLFSLNTTEAHGNGYCGCKTRKEIKLAIVCPLTKSNYDYGRNYTDSDSDGDSDID
jgi:hypothetical protein